MDESLDSDIFYNLISKSVLIESLKDTLDHMVEGYYITKESSDRIVKEALKEFQIALQNNKHLFSKKFVFGQMTQYKYFDQLWTFNVKNPLICSFISPTGALGGADNDVDDSNTSRNKSNISKDISRNLHTDKYKIFCFSGYLKIMAFEEF